MKPTTRAGMMGVKRSAGRAGGAMLTIILVAGSMAGAAVAQELSDKSMRTFMDYAWALTPQKFTKPNGQTIVIDKKKRDEVSVPMDIAREVIRVGRLSAHAQVCKLADEQVENYRSLMRREEMKKKWTDQQLIFINQLHLTTVMLLTGKLKLVERQGDKEVKVEESAAKTQTCTDEQKEKVRQMIVAYVKTGPAPAPPRADGPPSGVPATPASQKK